MSSQYRIELATFKLTWPDKFYHIKSIKHSYLLTPDHAGIDLLIFFVFRRIQSRPHTEMFSFFFTAGPSSWLSVLWIVKLNNHRTWFNIMFTIWKQFCPPKIPPVPYHSKVKSKFVWIDLVSADVNSALSDLSENNWPWRFHFVNR